MAQALASQQPCSDVRDPSVRQVLKVLRRAPSQASRPMIYRSWVNAHDTLICSKPDFSRVPYDRLKDFWALCGTLAHATIKDGEVRFL